MTRRSHGTLAFTDASDLPKPLEQIPMWTPLLKTTPARISWTVCFNSHWNSGFTSQVWTERFHIKNCAGPAHKKQARNSSSKQQQAAGKQQQAAASSSKQQPAAGKQQASSNQRLPHWKKYFTSCDPHHDTYTFCYWQIFWHSIWHIFWHMFWHIFWHSIWHSIWHIFWHIIWQIFWHSIWHSL